MDQYELIRTAHRVYGKSIRQIQRETGHHRVTIRKALRGLEPKYRRVKPVLHPVMGPVAETVKRWLREDRERPVKQRHTARRIYTRLVEEEGFQGSETTVRRSRPGMESLPRLGAEGGGGAFGPGGGPGSRGGLGDGLGADGRTAAANQALRDAFAVFRQGVRPSLPVGAAGDVLRWPHARLRVLRRCLSGTGLRQPEPVGPPDPERQAADRAGALRLLSKLLHLPGPVLHPGSRTREGGRGRAHRLCAPELLGAGAGSGGLPGTQRAAARTLSGAGPAADPGPRGCPQHRRTLRGGARAAAAPARDSL